MEPLTTDKIKTILKKHGFGWMRSPLHSADVIKKFSGLPDQVCEEKYFTIKTDQGLVMGRIYEEEETSKGLPEASLLKLIGIFSEFKVKNSDRVLRDLKKFKRN